MRYKHYVIILVIIFGIISFGNYWIGKEMKGVSGETSLMDNSSIVEEDDLKESQNIEMENENKRAWKESDPEDYKKYGITVTPRILTPSTTEEWAVHLEKNLENSNVMESEGAKEAIEVMQVNRQEYDEKMNKLEEDIETVKKRLEDEPFNEDHKTQLQNIYKIKAVGKVFEKKGIIK